MTGRTILHYRIIKELGRGGMGIVYKAEDTKLKREVAIKFLPPAIAANAEERKRLRIEAQAAAALNHDNIATIHAIEESGDELFIVMEYLAGMELKQKIGAGPLSVEEAQDIAIQIAEGLHAAHEKHVVHRDIKPGNIMMTPKGRAKIMDFGLAKVGAGMHLTRDHTTLGTASYMSPEQTKGEIVDHRTDIWSFGVVLYEMLAGELPFRGDFEQVIIYNILNNEFEPVGNLRPGIPDNLQKIVTRALAKNRDERYQSVGEILAELGSPPQPIAPEETTSVASSRPAKSLSRRSLLIIGFVLVGLISIILLVPKPKNPAAPARSSIAVLPFSDMSSQRDQEYLCDGITEEILARLAQFGELRVIARTSVMRYKEKSKSIREIGTELEVDTILEGSIRREGDDIKVTAQLIAVEDESHIWAQQYSRKMTHVFELQEEISKAIAQAMVLELAPAQLRAIASPALRHETVYDLVMQGRFEIEKSQNTLGEEGIAKGLARIDQALRLDSTYAPAYLEKAKAYHLRWMMSGYRNREALVQKFEFAKRAMRLDPHAAEAHAILGSSYLSLGERQKAYESLTTALRLSPSNSTALGSAAFLCRNVGLMEHAIALYKKLIEVDPFRLGAYHLLANFMIDVGRYDDAHKVLKRLAAIASEYDGLFRMRGILAVLEKDYDKADSLVAPTRQRNEAYGLQLETYLMAVRGEREAVLARGKDEALLMFLGMHDEAISYLDEKYRDTEGSSYLRLVRFPLFEPLQQDPRFLALVEREKVKYEKNLNTYGDLGASIIN